MKPTQQLHELGQSLWLDNITRDMLGDGTLKGYIDELSITGLTSNPTIFDKAISGGDSYDRAHRGARGARPRSRTGLLRAGPGRPARRGAPVRARPRAHRRGRRMGLARGLTAARQRREGDDRTGRGPARKGRPQHADQDSWNRRGPRGDRGVDLRRHPGQRDAPLLDPSSTSARPRRTCAGLERRIEAGLEPDGRVRGLGLHQPLGRGGRRPGAAGASKPARHRGRDARLPGLPRAARTRTAGRGSPTQGARPQRMLFASTGTKDPDASDVLYVEALAAP